MDFFHTKWRQNYFYRYADIFKDEKNLIKRLNRFAKFRNKISKSIKFTNIDIYVC
jgi:hypothetical protein